MLGSGSVIKHGHYLFLLLLLLSCISYWLFVFPKLAPIFKMYPHAIIYNFRSCVLLWMMPHEEIVHHQSQSIQSTLYDMCTAFTHVCRHTGVDPNCIHAVRDPPTLHVRPRPVEDKDLLRFLVARKWNVSAAVEQFQAMGTEGWILFTTLGWSYLLMEEIWRSPVEVW